MLARPGVGLGTVSAVLVGFGIANFLGTVLGGRLARRLRLTLMATPLLISILRLGLLALGREPIVVSLLVGLWGLAFGAVPVT